jgi:hypothetical protein
MGRTLMYTGLGVLGFFLLSATFVLQAGGGKIAAQHSVSVHEVTLSPEQHDGETVSVHGTLTYSSGRDLYELVDNSGEGANYAIVLRKYDSERLKALVGKDLTVSGRFGIEPGTGVYIDAEYVAAARP